MKIKKNKFYFILFTNKKNNFLNKMILKIKKLLPAKIKTKTIFKILIYNKKNLDLFDKYEIQMFPTLIIFKNGSVIDNLHPAQINESIKLKKFSNFYN